MFEHAEGLRQYMSELGEFVIKPDGLTGGKGVQVFGEHLHSIEDALSYCHAILAKHGRVEVEERLEGEEFSLQTITDGDTIIHCPLVQDHKRAYDGDEGPNTGGMGSYSCPDFGLPFLDARDIETAQSTNEQVIHALARETGKPYRGVLYGGFMATGDGVRLIEYNARFGDPEAMNVLPLLEADFVELCRATAEGNLGRVACSFASKATVCKYVVPESYPDGPATRAAIVVPDEYRERTDVRWFWAACRQEGSDVHLTGSRAGAFVGIGDTLEAAERVAEEAASAVGGPVRHREDIGRTEIIDARIRHMETLRGLGVSATHLPTLA